MVEQVRSRGDQQAMQAAVEAGGLYLCATLCQVVALFSFVLCCCFKLQQPSCRHLCRMSYGSGTSTQTVISRNPLARHRGEYDSKHLRISELRLHPRTVGDVQSALAHFQRNFAERSDLTGVLVLVHSCSWIFVCVHCKKRHTCSILDTCPCPESSII